MCVLRTWLQREKYKVAVLLFKSASSFRESVKINTLIRNNFDFNLLVGLMISSLRWFFHWKPVRQNWLLSGCCSFCCWLRSIWFDFHSSRSFVGETGYNCNTFCRKFRISGSTANGTRFSWSTLFQIKARYFSYIGKKYQFFNLKIENVTVEKPGPPPLVTTVPPSGRL